MGQGHGHGHEAGRAADRSRLRWVLLVTGTVLVAQLVGAWLSGSLALLADAGHMMTDLAAVVIALSASHVASRPATARRTFGWQRAEILAALVNAALLLVVCAYLLVEGVRRLLEPAEVDAGLMLWFALAGLAANVVSVVLLLPRRDSSLNMRAAYLEVLTDALGSVAVVIAAVLLLVTGFDRADALAALLIAVMILPRAFLLIREAVDVLLEAAPAGVDAEEVRAHLTRVPGVVEVHDLHVWTITSGLPSLSVHVTVDDAALAEQGVGAYLDRFSACVADHFDVVHTTFQVEPLSHREHEDLGEHHHP